MEIERKFLIKELPNLDQYEKEELVQGYLSFSPEVRIRSINNETFLLTEKSDGDIVREENECEINKEAFLILDSLITSSIIKKVRHSIPLSDGNTAYLDLYQEDFDGLITVEVEFKSKEEADNFNIPNWFGEEISFDKRYKNKNLAQSNNGIKDLLVINSTESIKTKELKY